MADIRGYAATQGQLCDISEEESYEHQPTVKGLEDILHPSCIRGPNQVEVRFPPLLQGVRGLLLGNRIAADGFFLAFFVGPDGFLDVFDVDDESCHASNGLVDFHMEGFGFPKRNVQFHTGSFREFCLMPEHSDLFDVFLATTAFCLGPQKEETMECAAKVLKEGGECFFRENFFSSKLPDQSRAFHDLMWGEGLSNTLRWEDFLVQAYDTGFSQPRLVQSTPVRIVHDAFKESLGNTKLANAIFRMFKASEEGFADRGYIVTYEGGIPGFDDLLPFDNTFFFRKGEMVATGSRLGAILQSSRYRSYFTFQVFDRKKSAQVENAFDPVQEKQQSFLFHSSSEEEIVKSSSNQDDVEMETESNK